MDRICQLPDELLMKVLSFLPTKVAVSTSILSKRWEFLWMWLPKLEYDDKDYSDYERQCLRRFLNLNMTLHKAPIIETLRLKFTGGYIGKSNIQSEDIREWVLFAVCRCVRELSLNLRSLTYENTKLPSNLYTCKSLVMLKLQQVEILVDVPRMACLPSLKTLHLRCVKYADEEKSLHKLLSSCPVLEDLVVEQDGCEDFRTLSVTVPSLQRLTLEIYRRDYFDRVEINTPSLKFLKLTDDGDDDDDDDDRYSFYSKDMPKLEEAEIDSTYVTFPDINKFFRSIRNVKRLSLCIRVDNEEALYREGIVFNQLQHLKLSSCDSNWSKLLLQLLNDSRNLRGLELNVNEDDEDICVDCIPACLLSSLETFKWARINGSQKEIDLVKYILRNGRCLKAAEIKFKYFSPKGVDELNTVALDLYLSVRASESCQLVIGY